MRQRLFAAACLVLAACARQPPPTAPASGRAAPAPAVAVAPVARPPAGDPVEGQRVARRVGCTGCHLETGAGVELWSKPGVFRLRSANLTQKRERYDDAGLHALIGQGKTHDGHAPFGMPIFMLQRISVHERTDIIAWVRALPPIANPGLKPSWWSDELRRQLADRTYPEDDYLPDPGVASPAERPSTALALGQYLAMTSCTECHGRDLRGWGPGEPPSLVVAKAYTPEAFTRLMRTGITASGKPSKTGFMSAVARQRFSPLRDDEIAALKAWLDARTP